MSDVIRSLTLICSTALLFSCALNPLAQRPEVNDLLFPSYEDLLPDGRTSVDEPTPGPSSAPDAENIFLVLTRLGVNLSSLEMQQLRALTNVVPSGVWARSQSQTAEQNLLANFRRFAPAFNPPINSPEEYRQRAVTFAEKTSSDFYLDLEYYLSNRRLLVVKWDETSNEFIVLQPDGSVVNYLITEDISPPRYFKIVF